MLLLREYHSGGFSRASMAGLVGREHYFCLVPWWGSCCSTPWELSGFHGEILPVRRHSLQHNCARSAYLKTISFPNSHGSVVLSEDWPADKFKFWNHETPERANALQRREEPWPASGCPGLCRMVRIILTLNGSMSLLYEYLWRVSNARYHSHGLTDPQLTNVLQLSIALLFDLGLNKSPYASDKHPMVTENTKLLNFNLVFSQSRSNDERRAFLGCFYLTTALVWLLHASWSPNNLFLISEYHHASRK